MRGVENPAEAGKRDGYGWALGERSTAGERRVAGNTLGGESSTEWSRRVKECTPSPAVGNMCGEGQVTRESVHVVQTRSVRH